MPARNGTLALDALIERVARKRALLLRADTRPFERPALPWQNYFR